MPATIRSLVQGFARNIRDLKSPDYKESQLRQHYLDPFLKLLGWDVDNREQRRPQDVEVMIEPSMDTVTDEGRTSREPDYLFRVNSFPRFTLEAKKPSVDIDTDRDAIYQTKRYAWNATIPFAILTDFEQFRVYDTAIEPIRGEPARGLIKEFSLEFQDYPTKWDEIVAMFGRDAVSNGSLERLRAKIRRVSAASGRRLRTVDRMLFELRGDEPVDRVFLDYLEKYRQHIARAIYEDNKKDFPEADTRHGAARLTEAVQRLIDRLVFMRVCEDPALDNNVLCGNSLINSADFDRYLVKKHGMLFPEENDDVRFRINRFDWESRTRGFGRLLDSQAAKQRGRAGFDCIIGNPPYIRVQELNKWAPDECEFYKSRYKSAEKGNYDIYVVFTERCLELLTAKGLLGFIMPHKFWQATYGAGLRKVIATGKHLRSVIDFRQEQVFRGATTYTAIHVFCRNNDKATVDYSATTALEDGVTQMAAIEAKKSGVGLEYAKARHPESEPWVFADERSLVSSLITAKGLQPLRVVARLLRLYGVSELPS